MELSQNEIAELKAMLAARKSAKPKASSPKGQIKLLVGPSGRVTGRVMVSKGDKPLKGHKFIADDKSARIGSMIKRGKVVPRSGQEVVYEVKNSKGEVVNAIVVDPSDMPKIAKGEKLVKRSGVTG